MLPPDAIKNMSGQRFRDTWRTVTLAECKCEHEAHPTDADLVRVVLHFIAFYPHDHECNVDHEDRQWTVRQRTMVGDAVMAIPFGRSMQGIFGAKGSTGGPLYKVLHPNVLDGSSDPVCYAKERNGCRKWPFSNHRVCELPVTKLRDPNLPNVNERYLVSWLYFLNPHYWDRSRI